MSACKRCGSIESETKLSPSGDAYCVDINELDGGCDQRYNVARQETQRPAAQASSTRLADGCPKCGGNSFRTVRSGGRKAFIGTAILSGGILGAPALLAGKNKVECILCGTSYARKG